MMIGKTTKSVLICVNERHIAQLLRANLTRQGHQVVVASSPHAACEDITRLTFEIAVIDEASGGHELAEQLRKRVDSREFEVIVLPG